MRKYWFLRCEQLHVKHLREINCNIYHAGYLCTVKPVLSSHSKQGKTKVLMTNGSLMEVESIAEYF